MYIFKYKECCKIFEKIILNLTQPNVSLSFGVTKYAQVSREPRTCGVHAGTRTRVWRLTRQREHEAREGLSVHAETARSVDPAISETETQPSRSRKRSRLWSRESVLRCRTRKIEGRSMTLITLPRCALVGINPAIFPRREAHVIGSSYFYAEFLELQRMTRPNK